jgi:hypothetical protein
MAEESQKDSELELLELRSFILRIPGEHFFCESVDIPATLSTHEDQSEQEVLEQFVGEFFDTKTLSPYPQDQVAWGYYGSLKEKRVFIFACPLVKLRQLGWQAIDIFRRVFPSFVSVLGKSFSKNTILFLMEDNTLSVITYLADSKIPSSLFSLPLESDDEESLKIARGKLLSLVDSDNYDILSDILVAGDVDRQKDGVFKFEHEWLQGDDPSLDLEQNVFIDSEELWTIDIRSPSFKSEERKRRSQSRGKWQATKIWSLSMAATLILFLGLKIFGVKLQDRQTLALNMATEVPLVIESRKLLEKLQQNKLGGIDPFGSIGRLYSHLGGTANNLNVWFTSAHFESRNEVQIKGEGKNIESINTFIENIEKNKVAILMLDRGGDERRKIRSAGGKTSFEMDIELIEDTKTKELSSVPN